MQYNNKEAARIIKKFGLSEKTQKVWKTRGKIPNKYLEMQSRPKKIDETKELKEWENILNILKSGKINKMQLSKLADISNDRIIYLQQNRGLPYKNEFISIKKELNAIRIKLKKINFRKLEKDDPIEIKDFLKLHANKLLVWHVILDRSKANGMLSALRTGNRKYFPTDQVSFLEQKIVEFLLESNI